MDLTYNLNGGYKPTMKRRADLDGPDYYPTPAWATFALMDNEPFRGEVWESACGDGAMSKVIADASGQFRSLRSRVRRGGSRLPDHGAVPPQHHHKPSLPQRGRICRGRPEERAEEVCVADAASLLGRSQPR